MKLITTIARLILGLTFILSGFVKGVDPVGTEIKLIEYFQALKLDFLSDYAIYFSFLLIYAEFIIGVLLFFNVYIKVAAIAALFFMLLFTPLTLWLALTNAVSDCGCFGDAIKLSNWETFYKNLFFLAFAFIVFFRRNKIFSILSNKGKFLIFVFFTIGIVIIILKSYYYLPLIEFLPFKKGNNIKELMSIPPDAPKDVYVQYVILKDTSTNKEIQVSIEEYSSNPKYWSEGSTYKYIGITNPILVKKGYQPPITDFNIYDENNNNYIDEFLNNHGYSFLLVFHNLRKASLKNIERIIELYNFAVNSNIKFYALTSERFEDCKDFISRYNLPFKFYFCDETTLKTIIRTNPGLVLVKDAVVIEKWSYMNFPTIESLKKIIK